MAWVNEAITILGASIPDFGANVVYKLYLYDNNITNIIKNYHNEFLNDIIKCEGKFEYDYESTEEYENYIEIVNLWLEKHYSHLHIIYDCPYSDCDWNNRGFYLSYKLPQYSLCNLRDFINKINEEEFYKIYNILYDGQDIKMKLFSMPYIYN